MRKNVALIGLGPHAKRIYLNYLRKHNLSLKLLVELESVKDNALEYLNDNGFKNTTVFTINDSFKDNLHLGKRDFDELSRLCKELKITHIIIATEPKGHNMYIEFALLNKIHVITDKPITVCKDMFKEKSVKEIRRQYLYLLELSKKTNTLCSVMCQRKYHKGYIYVKKLLKSVVKKYGIPITYIDIYHSDGNWEMPHDLLKENHPYKYGYGKLFHSGYHFIDLLSEFLKINDVIDDSRKNIVKGSVYTTTFSPNDEVNIFNIEDYKRIFKRQSIPEYYNREVNPSFDRFGEKNFYSLFKFQNKNNLTITNVSMNLLHYAYSRRGWINSRDYYKSNGRIRHERVNIQVGPLLNIQVHSYQAKEIKDRSDNYSEESVGGLEHFDIDIYRNVDVIGGKPFERISLGSLYTEEEKKGMLGYNELSREMFLNDFFKGRAKSTLEDELFSMNILYTLALGNVNKYRDSVRDILINYDKKDYELKELKMYANKIHTDLDKDLREIYNTDKGSYTFGVYRNYIYKTNTYEVYLLVKNEKRVVGSLFSKEIKSMIFSMIYFDMLKIVANMKNIKIIKYLLQLFSN